MLIYLFSVVSTGASVSRTVLLGRTMRGNLQAADERYSKNTVDSMSQRNHAQIHKALRGRPGHTLRRPQRYQLATCRPLMLAAQSDGCEGNGHRRVALPLVCFWNTYQGCRDSSESHQTHLKGTVVARWVREKLLQEHTALLARQPDA